jgi:hypothetical protein
MKSDKVGIMYSKDFISAKKKFYFLLFSPEEIKVLF